MLERNENPENLLVRPAVEAGEKLGFLPGDLTQKIDPYFTPAVTMPLPCSALKNSGQTD